MVLDDVKKFLHSDWRFTDLFTPFNLITTSAGFFLVVSIASPLYAVYTWYERKSSDRDTCIPYLVGVTGTFLWMKYGFLIHDWQQEALFSYAAIMQVVVISFMIYYRSKKSQLLKPLALIFSVIFLIYYHADYNLSEENAVKFVGRICTTFQCLTSLSILYCISLALKRKSVDFVPFPPVCLTLVVEIHVIIYSLAIQDIYLTISNGAFLILDGSLFLLFFVYPAQKSKTLDRLPSYSPRSSISKFNGEEVNHQTSKRFENKLG